MRYRITITINKKLYVSFRLASISVMSNKETLPEYIAQYRWTRGFSVSAELLVVLSQFNMTYSATGDARIVQITCCEYAPHPFIYTYRRDDL